MQLIATLIFFLSLAIALQPHVVHERRHITHPSWRKRSRVPTGHVLPMRIGLSQQNLHRGHELLMSISDPSSTNYSRHLTAKEVADMFAPARETAVAVKKWLVSAGIADERIRRTADGLWVGFEATVAEAEELFKTEYWAWEFKEGNGPGTVACDE
jgi:tripeptidyl-peptidase-1